MKNSIKIPLTKGYEAIIDADDYEKVSQFKWHTVFKRAGGKPYANTSMHISGSSENRKKRNITMHRFIIPTPSNLQIDHINGDTLDNRKENLRQVTNSQNHMNIGKMKKQCSSKYKGVSLRKGTGKWRSLIKRNGKAIELGLFSTELEAAKAYNDAAIEFHGTFAKLNIFTSGE